MFTWQMLLCYCLCWKFSKKNSHAKKISTEYVKSPQNDKESDGCKERRKKKHMTRRNTNNYAKESVTTGVRRYKSRMTFQSQSQTFFWNNFCKNGFHRSWAHLSTCTSWSSMVTSSLSSLFGVTSHNMPRAASLLASGSSFSISTLCCKTTFHPSCSFKMLKYSMYLSLHVYSLLYFYPCESVYTEAVTPSISPSSCPASLLTWMLTVITVVRGKVLGAGSYWPKENGGEQNIR